MGRSKKINVIALDYGSMTFRSDNPSRVTCEWGEWKNNACPLTFYGDGTGSATVKITHDATKQLVTVKVKVLVVALKPAPVIRPAAVFP